MIDSIAAIGDAGDINCWSGIPFHFREAALARGLAMKACRLNLDRFQQARRWWNLKQIVSGRGQGGYQYSDSFLTGAEAAVSDDYWGATVLTFNQHFPRARTVAKHGGRLLHYVDATFASFCTLGGLAEKLPLQVRQEAIALERENYACSEWVVTMARWTAESVVRDCGVNPAKVVTILPGANLTLPDGFSFPAERGHPGRDRPLILGFVGKDWQRKGLPFLLEVRTELERMNMPAVVRCAGMCPDELAGRRGLEYVGFINKAQEADRFLQFLTGCDVGCLFSTREPLGISTLEFLRAGVPVAGFTVEGVADTIPPSAGFRFSPTATPSTVAQAFYTAFADEKAVEKLREASRSWSPLLTWERCIDEWIELLTTGKIHNPVQPWRENQDLAALSVSSR